MAVTCHPHERGARLVRDPVLIVEVLSPGTERHDRRTKVPAYREIESVQEILLIDSEAAYAEIFRRQGASWFIEILRGKETDLYLSSFELLLPMTELYEGIELESDFAS